MHRRLANARDQNECMPNKNQRKNHMTVGPQLIPTRWPARLANLIHAIRNDWDEPGILAALHKIADRPLAIATMAAIIAATTRTDQRTPAIIAKDGHHWDAATKALGAPPYTPTPKAERCHHDVPEYGRCHQCQPPADPDYAKARAEQARAAIRENRYIAQDAQNRAPDDTERQNRT